LYPEKYGADRWTYRRVSLENTRKHLSENHFKKKKRVDKTYFCWFKLNRSIRVSTQDLCFATIRINFLREYAFNIIKAADKALESSIFKFYSFKIVKMENERFLDSAQNKVELIVFREANNSQPENTDQTGYAKMSGATTLEDLRNTGCYFYISCTLRFKWSISIFLIV